MVQRKTARYDLHHKITLAFASRSSLGLPVQSSYGETIPHTYFTSSLRCGLHTVFFVSLLMKLKASTGAVWGTFGPLQGLFPGICKDGTVECHLLHCLWETPEFLSICWQMRSQTLYLFNILAFWASECPLELPNLRGVPYQNHLSLQRTIYIAVVKFTRQIIASKCECSTFQPIQDLVVADYLCSCDISPLMLHLS